MGWRGSLSGPKRLQMKFSQEFLKSSLLLVDVEILGQCRRWDGEWCSFVRWWSFKISKVKEDGQRWPKMARFLRSEWDGGALGKFISDDMGEEIEWLAWETTETQVRQTVSFRTLRVKERRESLGIWEAQKVRIKEATRLSQRRQQMALEFRGRVWGWHKDFSNTCHPVGQGFWWAVLLAPLCLGWEASKLN